MTVISLTGLFLACDTGSGSSGSSGSVTNAPSVDDFDIKGPGGAVQPENKTWTVDISATDKEVHITPKSGKTEGAVTIYYNGSTTKPSAAGSYAATFDVAAQGSWSAAKGLSAGLVIITDPNKEKTPLYEHYTVTRGTGANATPFANTVTIEMTDPTRTIFATRKTDIATSNGIVTVKYNGNTNSPSGPGTYNVTFDVAADTVNNWIAVEGINAGTLVIKDDGTTVVIPKESDYNITGNGTVVYDGTDKEVTVVAQQGKSPGNVTVYYNGNTAKPKNAGTYTVTFNVAAPASNSGTTIWVAANDLSAGTLIISKATAVPGNFKLTSNSGPLKQAEAKSDTNPAVTFSPVEYVRNGTPETGITEIAATEFGNGVIKTFYNGNEYKNDTDTPMPAGSYVVTITVSPPTSGSTLNLINWEPITDLNMGTLEIVGWVNTVTDFNLFWEKEDLSLGINSGNIGIVPQGETLNINATKGSAYQVVEWTVDWKIVKNADGTNFTGTTLPFSSNVIGKHNINVVVKGAGTPENAAPSGVTHKPVTETSGTGSSAVQIPVSRYYNANLVVVVEKK